MVAVELWLARRESARASLRARLSDQAMILGTAAALITGVISAALGVGALKLTWSVLALGVLLGIGGLALRAFAIVALHGSYALTPQAAPGQAIVSRGPYRLIRHPGYAGILLSLLGLQLIAGTWIAVASLVFVILPLPLRIRMEEQLLIDEVGAPYVDYERRTPYRVIPGVY
jgi:protein-S-isoprenylcysteine O-methyltransferase